MKKIKYLISAAVASVALIVGLAMPAIASAHGRGGDGGKVTICHATSSGTNPWVRTVVSENAINGHFDNPGSPKAGHEGDILLEGDKNCPSRKVTPGNVTFTDPTCDTKGTYVIPDTQGVEYSVNDEVVSAGSHSAENGQTVTVKASALEGFKIAKDATTEWTHTYSTPTNCGQVLAATVAATPAATQVAAPVSGVKAGAGGADAASIASLLGLGSSLGATTLGLAIRNKRKN